MWIIDFPAGELGNVTHLLDEQRKYVVGRAINSDFHTDIKKVSKVQFVISFKDQALIIENSGKGKFDLNDAHLANGQTFVFSQFDKCAGDMVLRSKSVPAFHFKLYHKPFVLNNKAYASELNTRGLHAEYVDDKKLWTHYVVGEEDTIGGLKNVLEKAPNVKFVTREFIDSLESQLSELYDDFDTNWPVQQKQVVYTTTQHDSEEDVMGGFIEFVPADGEGELGPDTSLWGEAPSDYTGLVVTNDTKVYDVIKRNAEAGRRPRKRRKRKDAISSLKTMMDFPMDDFEVIKDEPEPIDEEKVEEEVEKEEAREQMEEEAEPTKFVVKEAVGEEVPETTFMEVDMNKLEQIQRTEGTSRDASPGEGLVSALQNVKREKEEAAQKSHEESLKAVARARVTRFSVDTSIEYHPKEYRPDGMFSNPAWAKRTDFSRFKKTSFANGNNPIIDSTIKGIKMRTSGYRSNGDLYRTSAAEKEMLAFNDGIQEMDAEFNQPQRKRTYQPVAASTKKRTRNVNASSLFVQDDDFADGVEDDNYDQDADEPTFRPTRRMARRAAAASQTEAGNDEDEPDDVPTFRRRR